MKLRKSRDAWIDLAQMIRIRPGHGDIYYLTDAIKKIE
jgi:hypothetical protein